MPDGRDVDMFPMPSELTVAQAARVLGVSETCLEQLLDIGAYEFRLEGNRRLIERDYLIKQAQWHARTSTGLDRIARWDQEMGLE